MRHHTSLLQVKPTMYYYFFYSGWREKTEVNETKRHTRGGKKQGQTSPWDACIFQPTSVHRRRQGASKGGQRGASLSRSPLRRDQFYLFVFSRSCLMIVTSWSKRWLSWRLRVKITTAAWVRLMEKRSSIHVRLWENWETLIWHFKMHLGDILQASDDLCHAVNSYREIVDGEMIGGEVERTQQQQAAERRGALCL